MSWIIFLDIVLALIFITTAVLITISSVNLYSVKDQSAVLLAAYHYSTWASVIAWLIVAVFIIALILGVSAFVTAAPEIEATSILSSKDTVTEYVSGFALFFLFLLLVLIFIIGVLSALTANNINNAPGLGISYHTAIAAAVLALLSSSIVFLWWIVDIVYYFQGDEVKEVKEVEEKKDYSNEIELLKKLIAEKK